MTNLADFLNSLDEKAIGEIAKDCNQFAFNQSCDFIFEKKLNNWLNKNGNEAESFEIKANVLSGQIKDTGEANPEFVATAEKLRPYYDFLFNLNSTDVELFISRILSKNKKPQNYPEARKYLFLNLCKAFEQDITNVNLAYKYLWMTSQKNPCTFNIDLSDENLQESFLKAEEKAYHTLLQHKKSEEEDPIFQDAPRGLSFKFTNYRQPRHDKSSPVEQRKTHENLLGYLEDIFGKDQAISISHSYRQCLIQLPVKILMHYSISAEIKDVIFKSPDTTMNFFKDNDDNVWFRYTGSFQLFKVEANSGEALPLKLPGSITYLYKLITPKGFLLTRIETTHNIYGEIALAIKAGKGSDSETQSNPSLTTNIKNLFNFAEAQYNLCNFLAATINENSTGDWKTAKATFDSVSKTAEAPNPNWVDLTNQLIQAEKLIHNKAADPAANNVAAAILPLEKAESKKHVSQQKYKTINNIYWLVMGAIIGTVLGLTAIGISVFFPAAIPIFTAFIALLGPLNTLAIAAGIGAFCVAAVKNITALFKKPPTNTVRFAEAPSLVVQIPSPLSRLGASSASAPEVVASPFAPQARPADEKNVAAKQGAQPAAAPQLTASDSPKIGLSEEPAVSPRPRA